MVGARGFEPLTPSASRKCSPPELSARIQLLKEQRTALYHSSAIVEDPHTADSGHAPYQHRRDEKGRNRPCTAPRALVHYPSRADVAQLVEHNLAKVGVAGSNPVVRSIDSPEVGPQGSSNSPIGVDLL